MRPRFLALIVLAAVVGAALLTATAAASAAAILSGEQPGTIQVPGGPPPPPPPPGVGGFDQVLREIGLSDEQIRQVKALRDAQRSASDPYEEQVGMAEKGIREAIQAGPFNEDAVRALAVTQAKAIVELRVINARTDAAILALLTAAQRGQLREQLKEMRPPRPGRGQRMPF